MAKNARQQKKYDDHWRDFDAMMEWFNDLRAYLLEAMFENIDLRIIARQFKRKLSSRGVNNRYFKRTRMDEYVKVSIE